ncbi:PKD domain-containing protein [Kitasatospora sp. NPDC051914]|uniref:PKD domain-containing protein n=1 Tax=Kitasatospora sp. NPDC051914 TaxID=3154945 RepID=UPI0034453854
MRAARVAGFAAFVLSVGAGLPLASAARADTTHLYVNRSAKGCSDTAEGAGSEAVPFCTVAAATAVVQPGQTVAVQGIYFEEVRLTRSGTADRPITITGRGRAPASVQGLVLTDVHDVRVEQFGIQADSEGVRATGAVRTTLDGLRVQAPYRGQGAAVRITGGSGVTLSRTIVQSDRDGITVDGTPDAVITTNAVQAVQNRGIAVTASPRTAVTSNSVGARCGVAVELSSGSPGSSVENNVLVPYQSGPPTCPAVNEVGLAVSTDSADGTVADYNTVTEKSSRRYVWADQPYADAAALHTATQQGEHDLAWSGPAWQGAPASSPLVDSADAGARGQLDTDLTGKPKVDNPLVADTGRGGGHHDRGAYELQDPLSLTLGAAQEVDSGDPMQIAATVAVDSPWYTATAKVDFGDGTSPVPVESPVTRHRYTKPGTYNVTATATDESGTTVSRNTTVRVAEAGPLVAGLAVTRQDDAYAMGDSPKTLAIRADTTGSVSPWPLKSWVFDYGDGTSDDRGSHGYAKPGTYTVTLTLTDTAGRTAKASSVVTVGSAFVALEPFRVLDTRRGDGFLRTDETRRLQVANTAKVPGGGKVTAVLLNLTATNAFDGGYITAWDGVTSRPQASSLNFPASGTVANAVVVPVAPDGTIAFYNHSMGVQLIADIAGYYSTESFGSYVAPVAPTRLLDTRNGTGAPAGKVGPGGTVRFQVRGRAGVPETAGAVTLNLTATEPTVAGYVSAAPASLPPTTSSLNFPAGRTVANQVTVPVAVDGTVTLYNFSGSVHLIADIQGFYAGGPVLVGWGTKLQGPTPFVATPPTRLLDTRSGNRTLGPGGTVRIKVADTAGVPLGARAVLVNLTAARTTATGYLTAYAAGAARPATSVVNFGAGDIKPNLALVPVSADGWIEVYNHAGTTDVVVDLQGYTA